jgi:glycosyltransferase involved in cell wall biosynthesis
VGRLKRYKGVATAIAALASARQRRADLTLDIAGTGDDRSRLEALAARLGVANAVRFLGFITDEHKLRLMRTAWANVFPSVKEGWGLTVVEAAACGTPSLTSNSPGLRDSVRDGVTGFLVPHDDIDALARRMLELAERPSLVDTLGKNARRFAESLTWDAAAARPSLTWRKSSPPSRRSIHDSRHRLRVTLRARDLLELRGNRCSSNR